MLKISPKFAFKKVMKQWVKTFCCLLTILILTVTCSPEDTGSTVQIRVKNTSPFLMTEVLVNTSGGEQFFGNLEPNQKSTYKYFEFAYRYAFVELKINNRTYTIQPIDYVGETVLTEGLYTYEIQAKETGGQYDRLSLKLVKD